jgi:transposase-like protein
LLVISDDNGAFRAAAEAVWGEVAWQLCLNHKLRAARRHVPAGMKKQFTAEAGEVFAASSREEAVRRANGLCKRWWPRARGGVQSLMRNFGLALSFCGFPTSWHEAIRTNNVAEAAMRTFRDALRRAGGSPCSTHGALAILLAQAIHFNDDKNP